MVKELVDGGAVREIAALTREAQTKSISIGGKEYATATVHDPRKPEVEPSYVSFFTLQSFCDYVLADPDRSYTMSRSKFVHIVDPETVSLRTGTYGEFNQRGQLAKASASTSEFNYGDMMGQEPFVIGLLTNFEPTPERERLFKLVGNLKAGLTQTRADDGVSQEATITKGIRMERGGVSNPFFLKPYRTFGEVEQPESAFWLRLSAGGENVVPMAALYEADGGRWRLAAVKSIKEFLRGELGEKVAVYG